MNNKLLKTLLCASLISTCAFGQGTDGKSVRLGVKLMPNVGWFNSPDKELQPAGALAGFGFGLVAEFKLAKNNNYAFATGLSITNQGGVLEYQSVAAEGVNPTLFFNSKAKTDIRLRYIDIPLMLKLKTNEIGYMTYFFNVGVTGGINVRATQNLTLTYNNLNVEKSQIVEKQDINEQVVVGRVLFVAGAGAEYNIGGNTSIFGSINWNNGLTNTFGKKATFYKYDAQGNPEIDPNGVPVVNGKFKAITNFLSLDIGVYF